ncbi:PREDICTED: apoptosis facilitator Bcl-2-like protein 14 [Merops nubicus]|uniref:apoptosis facilitator Bcl-2-like protein 14 n=1 Tax=Merops nubicus TaxID=57421 RepID=UPI0004F05EC2|nr:PREDICTED: apoptosis facilitator Bcl-2-like protein 14 [Merops nubicus]
MFSPNYVTMEEMLLQDEERGSMEYQILLAYARRRLPAHQYRQLLRNEANVQKSFIRRKVNVHHPWDEDGPSHMVVLEGPVRKQHSKEQPETTYLPGYCLPIHGVRVKRQGPALPPSYSVEAQSKIISEGGSQHQTISHPPSQSGGPSQSADVDHIADKLAELVASRSQESPSDVSLETKDEGSFEDQGNSDLTDGGEGKEDDIERIIQTIVSLLRQSGDKLEKKMEKDRVLCQYFKNMLSYNFFERITNLFLDDISADSPTEPGGQVQCRKVAFTMEIATRLSAVDNHPMNLVLGFGLKYLREHFRPWIQAQGGWEKALTSLDQEEVE